MEDDTTTEENTLDEEDTSDEETIDSITHINDVAQYSERKKLEAEQRKSEKQIRLTNAILWIAYALAASIAAFVITSVVSDTSTRLQPLVELQAITATVAIPLTVIFGFAAILISSIKNEYAKAKSGRLFLMAFITFVCMATAALSYRPQ